MVRRDCYRILDKNINFPFKLKGHIRGVCRWQGKQGTLELIYNGKDWIAHQSVMTEPVSQPSGQARAFVDIGVKCPITAVIEGRKRPLIYSGNDMLSDWWYWSKKIAECQSTLKKTNNKYTSKQLKKLYKTRTKRHKDAINKLINKFIKECVQYNVSQIYIGDVTNIRQSHLKGKVARTIIHNFWSHKYIYERLQCTSENYSISTIFVDERYTSSVCPNCGGTKITKRGRLFKCKKCNIELHRDVVGAVNISITHGNHRVGCNNWLMAQPEVVKLSDSFHTNNL